MKTMSLTLVTLLAFALQGCTESPAPTASDSMALPQPSTAPVAEATPADANLPLVVVHKSEYCGCCNGWVDHMRAAGFSVEVRNETDLGPIKEQVGVPAGKGSCHTAEIGGYFVEGHVPAEDIKRLLAGKPDAKGLVLPGMPAGSPGMEMPDGRSEPYTVELVARDGSTTPFARH
jgi:hypothetical protein